MTASKNAKNAAKSLSLTSRAKSPRRAALKSSVASIVDTATATIDPPIVVVDIAAKRTATALKAVATRRANIAAKIESDKRAAKAARLTEIALRAAETRRNNRAANIQPTKRAPVTAPLNMSTASLAAIKANLTRTEVKYANATNDFERAVYSQKIEDYRLRIAAANAAPVAEIVAPVTATPKKKPSFFRFFSSRS